MATTHGTERRGPAGVPAPGQPHPPGADGGAASCVLSVEGMDCASCAETVTRSLRGAEGVAGVQTDVIAQRVTVRYDPARAEPDALVERVRRAGYAARPLDETGRLGLEAERAAAGEQRRRLLLVAAAGVLWAGSLLAGQLWDAERLAAILAVGAIVTGGWYIVPRGVRAARGGSLDMNFLMSLAAAGALLIGEYGEAASAMFLFAVAQLLEARSMDRARHAIRGLMDLSPATASVLREGREQRVPAEEVRVGETVVVRPGEKLPVDGEVLRGSSGVDQAPITGESVPVPKEPGAEVFAGTLNGDGVLEVRSTRRPDDTTLARIIHSVEEAQASRAPSQSFVERFARVYTPLVVLASALVFLLPPLLGWGGWGEWFYRALVLLVVACPCALVISTPVTIVSALAGAARRGILIKGGLHLENAGRARVVALDKTGTLTEGEPAVVEVVPLNGTAPSELLALAGAAEARSEHPLARAIVRAAEEAGVSSPEAADVAAIPGRGVRARVGGRTVHLGTERLFRELGADLDAAGAPAALLRRHEQAGRTAVLVGREGAAGGVELLGVIALADRVRPQAAAMLRELHRAGIRRVVMLTGDNPGTARAVAEALGGEGRGVDEIRAGLLPEDKVEAVRELRAEHGPVVFVGDGVNDAPALAASDVGVAMGGAGTDVALETADIALMADDLSRLPATIRAARRAEGIIRVNIAVSLLTKAAFLALAAGGWATLWMAVAADMGTSLAVTLNGLRALRE